MEISAEQYEKIKDSFPWQRGNVRLTNLQILNAILDVAEQGCKWRALPQRFGNWHTIYVRMNRWAKNRVLERVLEKLQVEQIVRLPIEALSLDATSVKGPPDGPGALKKRTTGHRKSRGGWTTKIHPVAADARTTITFALSPGQAHDAPQGRAWLEALGPMPKELPLPLDRAYEDNQTRQWVLDLGLIPVVPPQSHRSEPGAYDRSLYKQRHQIERLLRRRKGFRRLFSRFEKLDIRFLAFLQFALIIEALRSV
jgi:transposase